MGKRKWGRVEGGRTMVGILSGSCLNRVRILQGRGMLIRNLRKKEQRYKRKRQRHRIELGGQSSES